MPKDGETDFSQGFDPQNPGAQSEDDFHGGQYKSYGPEPTPEPEPEPAADDPQKPDDGARGRGFHSGVEEIEIGPDEDWRDYALRRPPKKDGEQGALLSNAANIYLALTCDPYWRGRIKHDAMACYDLLDGKPITDNDVAGIQRWMQLVGLRGATMNDCHTQISSVAHDHAFDPLVDYLDSLSWGGKPRLDNWLFTYFKAKAKGDTDEERARQTRYIQLAGRFWLLQAIARAYNPGCKADYVLIPESDQGDKKSTACGILGGQWFSDSLPNNVADKDASQHLRGKWIIEIAELGALSRSEVTHLKAFLTRREEKYRPSYGRREIIEPRRCVFIATTNEKAYLRDVSGGRRFWPVVTNEVDIAALKGDRHQLLAEAVAEYKKGGEAARHWPTRKEEEDYFTAEQEARFQDDAWEDKVAAYLDGKKDVTVGEVAREALFISTPNLGRQEQNRIAGILERLKWVRGARLKNRKPWVKKG